METDFFKNINASVPLLKQNLHILPASARENKRVCVHQKRQIYIKMIKYFHHIVWNMFV